MEQQRIILANIPRFLDEMLVRAFIHVPDLLIIDRIADWTLLSATIQRTGAQWIIVSWPSGHTRLPFVKELFAEHPAIRLLNVATDGSHITLQWVEPHEQTIDDFSMVELIALLTNHSSASLPASDRAD